MLRAVRLSLSRGTKRLLEGAELAVHAGQKVGLVGPNGCGKSSLFALLRGELLPDAGEFELPASWTIAHVAQQSPEGDAPAIEFVLDGDRELRALERSLAVAAAPETQRSEIDGTALAALHHRYEEIDGYRARARAAILLSGLGIPEARHRDPVDRFSGGFRMRLALAQALAARSDLLLLDEPTNHLDLDAVLWLEDWLSRFRGTLVLVTHDRDFLDAIVDTIVHFEGRRLVAYPGTYAQFEAVRGARLALEQAAFKKQQRRIAHLRSFIDRFRAKATKARQAQSRIKAIERMEKIAIAHVDSPFEFSFPPTRVGARQLLRLEDATLGYGDEGSPPVLANVEWSIHPGDRIGLLGPNGAGKSTLLKTLAGALPLQAGTRHAVPTLAIGYFAQQDLESLAADETPFWHFRRREPDTPELALRTYLGGFDFGGPAADTPVRLLSGGEKARLALALIVRAAPNVLLLDEPTNHLDLEMREALAEALQDYDGALVVVAHDRHLLRATTDTLWLVADGRLEPFAGDLDDYRDLVLGRKRGGGSDDRDAKSAEPPAEGESGDRKARRRAEAEMRQRAHAQRKPLEDRQAEVESELSALSTEKRAIDAALAVPETYAADDRAALRERIARSGELAARIEALEAQWLELSAALERAAQPTVGPGR